MKWHIINRLLGMVIALLHTENNISIWRLKILTAKTHQPSASPDGMDDSYPHSLICSRVPELSLNLKTFLASDSGLIWEEVLESYTVNFKSIGSVEFWRHWYIILWQSYAGLTFIIHEYYVISSTTVKYRQQHYTL